MGAEIAARELRLSLEEALDLVLLYAAFEPAKLERAALRWLVRYIDEKGPFLLQTQIAVAALSELSSNPGEAEKMLRGLAG